MFEHLFWQEGDQKQAAVAQNLAQFIEGARHSLHLAIFDFRLQEETLRGTVVDALKSRAATGIQVRIAFDHTRTARKTQLGSDPAPRGTQAFIEEVFAGSRVQVRPITGSHLMHNKYLIRDGNTAEGAVWTGSANWTDDAWTVQENNIAIIQSRDLCFFYERDFGELWTTGDIQNTGLGDLGSVRIEGHELDVAFSPGEGRRIDHDVAYYLGAAHRRVRLCAMVVSSGAVLGALTDVIQNPAVDFIGVVDATQMRGVEEDWSRSPASAPKLKLWNALKPHLHGKHSHPYRDDGIHDFMHNKILVADDVVVTGSFNFSENATRNAENIVAFHNRTVADAYTAFIDKIAATYPQLPG